MAITVAESLPPGTDGQDALRIFARVLLGKSESENSL